MILIPCIVQNCACGTCRCKGMARVFEPCALAEGSLVFLRRSCIGKDQKPFCSVSRAGNVKWKRRENGSGAMVGLSKCESGGQTCQYQKARNITSLC